MSAIYDFVSAIANKLLAKTDYYAPYTAQIVAVFGDGSLQINPQNPVFSGISAQTNPNYQGIPLYPGVAGCTATPVVGQMCLFSFLNGNPGQPYVLGVIGTPSTLVIEATESITEQAATITLNPNTIPIPTLGVARTGDAVSIETSMAAWVAAVTALLDGPSPAQPVLSLGPGGLPTVTDFGVITGGSTTVKAGD